MKSNRFVSLCVHAGRFVSSASGAMVAILGMAMTLLITIDVLGRFIFGMPTFVAAEASGYMLVALVFVGLAYTESEDRHIYITTFTQRFPPRIQKSLLTVTDVIAVMLSGYLVHLTLDPVIRLYKFGTTSIAGMPTPMWIPSALIPLGFCLFTIVLIVKLVNRVRSLTPNQLD